MISWVCVVPFEIVIFLDLAYRFISFIFCCPSGVVSNFLCEMKSVYF